MDVTSLLNANSVAVEQQRKMGTGEHSKTPTKNRTPWDAGGYSLPINTLVNSTHSTAREQNFHHDDSQSTSAHSPTSPHHKLSDSHSSLSSFASSLQSTNHSRFSSTSTTVSGTQPSISWADNLSPVSNLKIHEMDLSHLTPLESNQPPTHEGLSPMGSPNALALPAEHEIASHESASPTPEDKMAMSSEQIPDRTSPATIRPSSPSEIVMIKRRDLPSLRLVTGDHELNGKGQNHHLKFPGAPSEARHRSLVHPRTHKRALSAPDFGPSNTTLPTMAMRPLGEPTPPSSHHPDIPSPTTVTEIATYSNPDTPPTTTDNESHALVCMYVPNCDTNSQLRKAISHIFGRNKMCTRLVPSHVWVHYCRKHYQRSRYRNPKEYAKLQCDLVQQQIRRVHEWSSENAKKGVDGTVRDWSLSVRKREQKRLDDLGVSRKRTAIVLDQDGENQGEGGIGRPAPVPATAVPQWLYDRCDKGYSTHEILEIFNRLHTEILQDTLPCFPDIEILPNVVVDQEEHKGPKGYTRRPAGHKRAQSLGVGLKSTYQSPVQDRRLSQPALQGQDSDLLYASPTLKRRRQNETHETSPIHNTSFSISQPTERPMESDRHVAQLVHRPTSSNVEEQLPDRNLHYVRRHYYGLQAPTPQRPSDQSMAAHLENSSEHGRGRPPIHQRSRSDMSNFGHRYEYSFDPNPVYAREYAHHNPYYQQPPPQIANESTHSRFEPVRGQFPEKRQPNRLPAHGHQRAQSSSMIQPSYSSSMPTLQENQAQVDMSPYTHSPPHQLAAQVQSTAHINETQDAHAVFSARR